MWVLKQINQAILSDILAPIKLFDYGKRTINRWTTWYLRAESKVQVKEMILMKIKLEK